MYRYWFLKDLGLWKSRWSFFSLETLSKLNLVEIATTGIVIIAFTFQQVTRLFYPYALIINPRYYSTWILNGT